MLAPAKAEGRWADLRQKIPKQICNHKPVCYLVALLPGLLVLAQTLALAAADVCSQVFGGVCCWPTHNAAG